MFGKDRAQTGKLMPHFFCKLIGPRPTFPADMTEQERAVMQEHSEYWKDRMSKGAVHVFGPVMDPGGAFGMGVIEVADMDAAQRFAADDPVMTRKIGFKYEIGPMRAILRGAS
jgi:uncharacterized protein YciI